MGMETLGVAEMKGRGGRLRTWVSVQGSQLAPYMRRDRIFVPDSDLIP